MSKIQYIISGTNDGYNDLRSSLELKKGVIKLIDNRGQDKKQTLGKTCYSLSIQNEFYIFSKIQIVKDGLRSKSLGFIKFNLVIPKGIKLNTNIFNLLDECLGIYTKIFIDKNSVLIDENKSNNSFNDKIESILSEIQIINGTNYNWSTGNQKPAYIYLNNSNLHSYFEYNSIFQNDYKNYIEIYFIDEKDKGEDGILNALKHEPDSDLTERVNLEKLSNPSYTIKYIGNDPNVSYVGINNGQEVKLNDFIKLEFNKKNYEAQDRGSYYGKLSDLINKNPSIFKKSLNSHNTIEIHEPKFTPLHHEVTISFVDENGKKVSLQELDVKFSQKRNSTTHVQTIKNGVFSLEGELKEVPYRIDIESKNNKYRSKSVDLYFSQNIKIKLQIKKQSKKFPIKIVIGVLVVGILFGVIRIINPGGIFTSEKHQGDNNEKDKKKNTDIQKINKYLEGDELLVSELERFKIDTIIQDTLKTKLQKSIEFRSAIDGDNRNKIQYVYDSIKKLNDVQNNILKLILDTYPSKDFHNYVEITNRQKLTISVLKDKIISYKNSIIQDKTELEAITKPEVKKQPLKSPESTINTIKEEKKETKTSKSYTDDEFFNALIKKHSVDVNRLNNEHKSLNDKYNALSPREKSSMNNTINYTNLKGDLK